MMASPMTLLRLTWRPLTLLQVAGVVFFYIVLAAVRPLSDALQAVWYATATPQQRVALWHAMILIPGMAGLMLGYYRLELQHTMMSWPVPALRQGLVAGAATVAMPLALSGSLLMLRNADASLALAAFAVALMAFALGWFLYDVAVPWPPRLAAAFALAGAALSPTWIVAHVEARPLLAALFALSAVTPLMAATLTRSLARRRVLLGRYFDPGASFPFIISTITRPEGWKRSLATDRLMPWIRATLFESTRRYPRDYIVTALFVVLLGRMTGLTIIPLVALCNALMLSSVRLHELWYPVSRAQRATIAFGAMLMETATYVTALAVVMSLSYALPLPTIELMNVTPDRATPQLWLFTIVTGAALAPIAQWAQLRWPDEHRKSRSSWRQWAMFWRLIIFTTATGIWIVMIGDSGGAEADVRQFLLLTVALAAGMQVVSWWRVREHFLHTDLIKRGA